MAQNWDYAGLSKAAKAAGGPEKYVEMRLIKDGLSFIKPEVIRFGVYFMNGLKKLKIEDYDYIYKHCINKMSISEN